MIIITDATFRAKYGYLLAWRVQVLVIAVASAYFIAVGAWVQTHPLASSELCVLSFLPVQYWFGFLGLMVFVYGYCVIKLIQIRDALGMGIEILRAITAFIVLGTPMFTLIAAMQLKLLPINTRLTHMFVIVGNPWLMMEIYVFSRPNWGPEYAQHLSAWGVPKFIVRRFRWQQTRQIHSFTRQEANSYEDMLEANDMDRIQTSKKLIGESTVVRTACPTSLLA